MSLVTFAAERAMVFGLVAEKLLEVPSVGLLVVVLVPLCVGVALGVCLQKCRAEAFRVNTLQDLLVFLPRSLTTFVPSPAAVKASLFAMRTAVNLLLKAWIATDMYFLQSAAAILEIRNETTAIQEEGGSAVASFTGINATTAQFFVDSTAATGVCPENAAPTGEASLERKIAKSSQQLSQNEQDILIAAASVIAKKRKDISD
eukprot:s832_g3.t1